MIGTYWAQSQQHADKYCLSGDLLQMLNKVDNMDCSNKIRGDIDQVLDKLSREIEKRRKYPMRRYSSGYKDNMNF